MPRYAKEDLDRYFDYNIFSPKRLLFLASRSDSDGEESGVNYEMFNHFLKGITYLDSVNDQPITIHLNTMGGDWYHGMAIFRAIRACRSYVRIVVWGYACSMGSVILQAADSRVIAQSCILMIHDGSDEIVGDARSVERWGEQSKKNRQEMYRVYLDRIKEKHPNTTLKRIESLCSHDTIYSAEEAVEMGLADQILEALEDIHSFADEEQKYGKGKKHGTKKKKGSKK